MKTIQVEMLGFGEKGVFRPVNIPEEQPNQDTTEGLLEAVFYWGQNDFQPSGEHYSVSVGDVIWLDGEKWLVKGAGFKKLDEAEYIGYSNLDQKDRNFVAMGFGG